MSDSGGGHEGVTTYTYDADGRLTGVTAPAEGRELGGGLDSEAPSRPTYVFDGAGRLTGWVDGDGWTVGFGR